ncbi:hypothetical protein PpBr36_02356 [Pyricularia pennisetigena]|uniref:hypothetical protein n=1 Tax=Pyricularia pennisetigena TaxID=1578925 RepID=UPI0011505A80|nr:hypothetical protein PpBr36_02356 [Pyricularia pennisetigena]TLS31629.1 hypothetical protein PpBr36_02356 [Pyricularia pennisetigena]
MDSMEEFGAAAGHQDPRRTLLVVYIHGFMGNDTSFQRFPAHMHEFLRESLAETHAVHTKIYPRYKTYRTIDVATENFSRWLSPHESSTTDVVLVGHSMGGLLAADVVLLPAAGDQGGGRGRRRHRILGTVSLDSPFLGLHPGIITAGIASLFRKSPEPPGKDAWAEADQRGRLGAVPSTPNFPALSPSSSLSPEPSLHGDLSELSPAPSGASSSTGASYFQSNASQGTVGSSSSSGKQNAPPSALDSIISIGRSATAVGKSDPHYNPPFFNDVQFKDRGFLRNVWHFAQKRKLEGENLIDAATDHIVRHLQFGKCLADLKGLHARYDAIRALEDESMERRVRFVNYYTASTGRLKEPKEQKDGSKSPLERSHSRENSTTSLEANRATLDAATCGLTTTDGLLDVPERASDSSQLTTPRISIKHHGDSLNSNTSGVNGASTSKAQEAGDNREANGSSASNTDLPHEQTDPETPPPEYESGTNTPELRSISPNPEAEEAPPPLPQRPTPNTEGETSSDKPDDDSNIPPAPQEPQRLNIPEDAKPEERKRLEKEYKQALKKYEQDVKARIKAIKERDKALEKERSKKDKEKQKREKEEQKRLQQQEKKREKEAKEKAKQKEKEQGQSQASGGGEVAAGDTHHEDNNGNDTTTTHDIVLRQAADAIVAGNQHHKQADVDRAVLAGSSNNTNKEEKKPKKLRKFCMLPRKKSDGSRDSCWIDVYMEGMDEVGAHCGLFFPGPQYETLIGDVGMRIQGWVHEDASRRAILEV